MNIVESVLLGKFYEDDNDIWEPILYQDKPVLTPDKIKEFFDVDDFSGLVNGRDYIVLSGPELRTFYRENKIRSNIRRQTVYTMPGIIRLLSLHPCNSFGIDFVVTALNLTYSRLSDVSQLKLAFSTFQSVYEADKLFLESRMNRLEQSSTALVPVEESNVINVDRTSVWQDDLGFYHVNYINRHVVGYFSMTEVAANLNLYSNTMNPHTQLAEEICRTALKIPRGAEKATGDLWQTFKYSHYDSGKRHDKNCLRITDEGMNFVRDWWFRHASEFAFEEKNRHGYHFSKKYDIYKDIPLMGSYQNMVNPTVGNVDNSNIIDVDVEEHSISDIKYDAQGRPDLTDVPFYDSKDQNPDGTWKDGYPV
jgi:hypothetical protein